MTHVHTAPYSRQSNGKIEAWHKTLKVTAIRPKPLASLDEARRVVAEFVASFNTVRRQGVVPAPTAPRQVRRQGSRVLRRSRHRRSRQPLRDRRRC
jgi:transposase InsO family protein